MGHLARPLAGEQDQIQWRAQLGPEHGDLGVASTPKHGFAAMISCRTAQPKIGLAAARTWFARTGAAMAATMALTSTRLMSEGAGVLRRRGLPLACHGPPPGTGGAV
jgi:hypothetical protein